MLNHKNIGFITAACFCLSLLISASIIYHYYEKKVLFKRVTVTNIKFPFVSKQDKTDIQRLFNKIPQLVTPSPNIISHLDLRVLGYRKNKQESLVPVIINDDFVVVPEELYKNPEDT